MREKGEISAPCLLVGSSMGGFYGAWLADRLGFQHLVMINPALQPWLLLKQVVGWQFDLALQVRYYLSQEMVAATRAFATDPAQQNVPTTVLIDKGDELIDYRITKAHYRGYGEVRLFEGGSHAFEHMDEAVLMIADLYSKLSN
jgi:predicted esterase YcpF (UPF0227 family)